MSSSLERSPPAGENLKAEPAPSAESEHEPQCEYCRLCATQFPTSELRKFSVSNEESNGLLVAIRRMNSSIQRGDELPQTACKECIRLLEAVEVIIRKIANAQRTLTDIFKRVLASNVIEIKMENTKISSSCINNSDNELSSDSECLKKKVKAETINESNTKSFIDDSDIEPTSDSLTTDMEAERKKKKKKTSKLKKKTKLKKTMKVQRKRKVKMNAVNITSTAQMMTETASRSSKLAMLPLYNSVPTTTFDNEAPVKSEDPTIPRWSDFFCCKRCNHRAQSIQDLRKHSWLTHKLCIVFKCVKCPGPTINFKRFFRHMIIKHHSTLEQCCEFCNQCFVSSSEVRFHKELEHTDEAKAYKCKSCGTSFDLAEELQSHRDSFIISHAKDAGNRRFKCTVCDKEFINKIRLESHLEEHDPTKNICEICNKKLKNKYCLKEHMLLIHNPESVRLSFCQICGKSFKRDSTLKEHVSRHMGNTRFSCNICEKKFITGANLKEHQRTHTDVKQFVCNICGQSYKFKSGLNLHIKTHGSVKPYSCDVCDRGFNNWSNCNKHMKRIHQLELSKRKPFQRC